MAGEPGQKFAVAVELKFAAQVVQAAGVPRFEQGPEEPAEAPDYKFAVVGLPVAGELELDKQVEGAGV